MNFLNPYSRSEYKKFFQDNLLTDSFRIIEEEIKPEFTAQFIKKAELIGRDKSLELEVYEIEHGSENDPRVGISKDFFRLMASYGSKRALAIFHSPKSPNYRLSLATVEYSLHDTKIKREYSNPRRFSFFLGPDAKVHTPYDFLIKKGRVKDFDDLQNRFSIEVVNKEFYKEIANWYFWTLKKVKFPDDAETEKNGKEISVIRLITRLIFIWFMKVRKLVPEELFNENALKGVLTDLKLNNDNYYKAILQNLFFATLNTKQEDRRFTSKKKGYKGFSQDFGNHNVYRYEESFKASEEVIEKYFLPIPFLNGGLFECLDYKTKTRDERKYIDGFTSTKSQQPVVPNFLFFNDDREIDLNKDYGTTNKKYNVRGLINTLSLYNFTIDESDPNDADVALDPELLGKVFENLLASYNPETAKTARKSTGSYYTPRPIVDYMVDESLKQYLKTHIQSDDIDDKLNILFAGEDQSNPFDTELTKKLVDLIDSLRVVDPAVGSGAFPMRILNRLVFLLHKLDPDNSLWKQSQIDGIKKSVKDVTLQRKFIEETERKFKEKNPNYGRKLYLIEKCIYGVDIQQIAVEIAKLRFFISLLVDEKVENGEIEPLPNLDFKLMQGNSLISSFAGIDFTTKPQNEDNLFDFNEKYKQLIEEFEELKSQYQNEPAVKNKNTLREKIDNKLLEIFEEKLKQHYPQLKNLESKYGGREEIIEAEKKKLFKKIGIDLNQAERDLISYTEGRKQKDFFLWDVYFAEVFAENGGFDIVIGNPPYIRIHKQVADNKEYYKTYYNSAQGDYDIYVLFLERSFDLIKEAGVITLITPDKYLVRDYGFNLRSDILKYQIVELFDLSRSADIFDAAVYPLISIFRKVETDKNISIKIANTISNLYNNYKSFEIRKDNLKEDNRIEIIDPTLSIIVDKVLNNQRLSSILSSDQIFCGTPRAKDYHRWKNFVSTKKVNNSLKMYVCSNLSPYTINHSKEIRTVGLNISTPYFHNRGQIVSEKRWDDFKFNPKILIRGNDKRITAVLDEEGSVFVGVYAIKVYENIALTYKYLLASLNSKLYQWIFSLQNPSIKIGGGYFSINSPQLLNLPFKLTIENDYLTLINKTVHKILSKKKQNPKADTKHLEDQIDIMVYKLYNLTYEEVKIIDPEIEKIISEKEYEKFEV